MVFTPAMDPVQPRIPMRGETFVTRKITRAVARIKMGLQDNYTLETLMPSVTGGMQDYVEMQWLMLQQDEPEDFCIATGVQYSVSDMSCGRGDGH